MSNIHPTAIIDKDAEIGSDCFIGPYSVVGAGVRLADRVHLRSHVVIEGDTRVGEDTQIYPFAAIGLEPQDLKFEGEHTTTVIGARNTIREYVTVHRGTAGGGGETVIGDDNLLMAQVHIAHDCRVGNKVIMANASALAGHVEMEDGAYIGGFTGVHQFCRIGREAYLAACSLIVKDALPFAITQGNHAKCFGLNRVGMKRKGYSKDAISKLKRAYKLLLSSNLNTTQALDAIKAEISDCEEVDVLVGFIESSERGVAK